jgi:hypothetical protein
MIIPAPTPIVIEAVLAGIMDGRSVLARWVKLDDAHLPDGGEETRLAMTMWWVDAMDVQGVLQGCVGGGSTATEAAAAAWVQVCLGAWWFDGESGNRVLTNDEYLSVPRRVPATWRFEVFAVPTAFPGADKVQ